MLADQFLLLLFGLAQCSQSSYWGYRYTKYFIALHSIYNWKIISISNISYKRNIYLLSGKWQKQMALILAYYMIVLIHLFWTWCRDRCIICLGTSKELSPFRYRDSRLQRLLRNNQQIFRSCILYLVCQESFCSKNFWWSNFVF